MTTATAQKPAAPQLSVGDKAPPLTVQYDSAHNPESFKGKHMVLYFYPKDDTPGCTTEAKDFRDHLAEFTAAGAVVIGASRDSLASHEAFGKKYCLPFPLASDDTGATTEAYGVWGEKSMYGKSYMGIDRSTFLIDKNGTIRNIWRKVKVDGHVKEVLAALKGL